MGIGCENGDLAEIQQVIAATATFLTLFRPTVMVRLLSDLPKGVIQKHL